MSSSSSERWPEIERLLDRALDLPPGERKSLVEQTRSEDPALGAEVERLLEANRAAADFLAESAATFAAPLLGWAAEQNPLADGSTFGPYAIVRRLGRGATATVYLARDPKHRRPVAVKVLHPELAAAIGPERFLREIEIAATLQHPHVLPLFDSGAIEDLLFYVMPYVEGESLRATLAQGGRMQVEDALRIAREVAGALDYSHRRGVVHRDIKPENILLQDGQAIVADFGIARAIDAGADQSTEGRGTGTPAYMSPEQAGSQALIDGRSDIYALGCVLYEMLAGRPPFGGESVEQILAGHLHGPVPALSTYGCVVPPGVEPALRRALEKRATDRYATAAEFAGALGQVAGETSRRIRRWPWVVGAGAVLTAIGVVLGVSVQSPDVRLGRRTPFTLDAGLEIDAAISPDGRFVAYAAGPVSEPTLFVRPIEATTPTQLAPGLARPQRFPRWSPDGRRLLFRSPRGIEVTPAMGGETTLLIRDPSAAPGGRTSTWGTGATLMPGGWSPDGRQFAYVKSDSLFVVGLDGQSAFPLTSGGEPHSPVWSPDGRWVAFVRGNLRSLEPGFQFGNVGESTIWVIRALGGDAVPVTSDRSSSTSPVWLPTGHALLFVSNRDGGRDIYRATLSRNGSAAGPPIRLTTGLDPFSISLSADGRRLVYTVFSESSNIWTLPIPTGLPVSVSGARPLTGGSQVIEGFDVSPDSRWLAYDLDRSGNHDIFRIPVEGGEPERLTSGVDNDFGPIWSPDGREMAFHSFHDGGRQIFVMSANGADRVQVTHGADDHRSPKWLAGGQGLLFTRNYNRGDAELLVVHRERSGRWGTPRTILRADLLHVAVAPAGDGVAFSSGRGLNLTTTTGDSSRVLVPVNYGGLRLRPSYVSWSDDGRELYYLALDPRDRATIWAVARSGGPPRLLVRFDDPTRPWHRFGFRAHRGQFYFTLGDQQSDIWSVETTLRR